MALTYQDIGASVSDVNFQNRVIGALEAQAIVVNNEVGTTPNHTQRLALLGRVVTDPAGYARRFTPLVASVAPVSGLTSTAAATDAQILTGVATVWDAFAVQGI
jgi:hypothetical protein